MLKHLRFDNFELQETKLPVQLINTANEQGLVREHEDSRSPLRMKLDIEDISRELDDGSLRLHFLYETPTIILLSAS
ncbi:hypothetical protein TNCV_11791 [Trichonephila clavipes]|nr:hypothetical protein TNCV_11791 [Trichonephila clavipes]